MICLSFFFSFFFFFFFSVFVLYRLQDKLPTVNHIFWQNARRYNYNGWCSVAFHLPVLYLGGWMNLGRVKTESKPSQRPTTNSGMRVSSRERTMKREGCDVARVERGAGPNSLLTGRKLDEMISGLRLTLAKDRPGAWEQQRWSPASVGWSRVEPRGASRWGRQAAAKRCAGSEPVAPERFSVPESPVRLTS